ncbi:cation transporter [Intrasporangium oryzae]|nr:cation transporter [Intrasporangium oryzae]
MIAGTPSWNRATEHHAPVGDEMTDAAQDRASYGALRLSVVAGAVSAVLAVVWGLAAGSRVILFDGVSAGIGLVMSLLSLAAARAAAAGDSPAFPYGRQAMLPMAIGAQGIARLGFTAYAVTDAVLVILAGGDDVETGSALLYAAVAAVLCIGVALRLRTPARRDELVAAEELGWRIASLLSVAILVGFSVVALLPEGDAKATAGRYVDPVLVLVVSLIVLPAPLRLVRTMFRELLEMRPPEAIETPARAAVTEVCASMGLHEPVIRMTKTGARLYLEVDHVVEVGEWDVSRIDRLRAALLERLAAPTYAVWLNVELSCDPTWQLA